MIPEVVCYGDCLRPNIYRIHSRFAKAVNYTCDETLISLVTPYTGAGPNNIVTRNIELQTIESIRFDTSSITIGDTYFELRRSKMYTSCVALDRSGIDSVMKRLQIIRELLVQKGPPKSLVFLLKNPTNARYESMYDANLADRIRTGVHELQEHRYDNAIHRISGAGYGLTPSGDDFIAGFLSGLYILSQITGKNLDAVRETVFKAARPENIISKHSIYYAYRGRFYEHTKRFVTALCAEDSRGLEEKAMRVISTGETSGADFMTGFLFSFLLRIKSIH